MTKATGVTYHTSPMGVDHTAGVSYDDAMADEGQVERSLKSQIPSAMIDSLGYCYLAAPSDPAKLVTFLKDLVNARYGANVGEKDLMNIGRQALNKSQ